MVNSMSRSQIALSKQVSQRAKRKLATFGRNEDGTIIVMTLLFFVMFIVLGGMAVDFMRFEARRALLQSTADRAVLAAADLTQDLDPSAVVIDYFQKAGFGDNIVGTPDVIDEGIYKSVGVRASITIKTVFLKYTGIPTLAAPAAATAIEGISNVEVSLVVDISGSMRDPVTPTDGSASQQSKIEALREASETFARVLLTPQYKDRISISLVPYSQQVNAGPDILNGLTGIKSTTKHNYSHCIEFTDQEMRTMGFDDASEYEQGQHFQWNWVYAASGGAYLNQITDPICPFYDYERIVPISQDVEHLVTQIKKLQPRAGTAIYLGMKWGVSLLDPAINAVVKPIATGHTFNDKFKDRPEAYALEGAANPTQKVIVLMTDGQNSSSARIMPDYYKNPNDRAHWAEFNLAYSLKEHMGYSWPGASNGVVTYQKYKDNNSSTTSAGTNGDDLLLALCTAAKAKPYNIIIYAVAVEAEPHGRTVMSQCASSASHYFPVSGDLLKSTFENIARQITELRLSL